MKKIIVANWKMNPATLAEAQEILERTDEYLSTLQNEEEFTLIFCPPFVFLEEVGKFLGTSRLYGQALLGAQDIAMNDTGSLTGEVSGPMLRSLGVRYVIIGHSERRWKLGESDEVVNQKLKAALRNELVPIVCIGERVRDNDFKIFLKEQLAATFKGLSKEEIEKCIIAYEPVWAISSNPDAVPDSPKSATQSISAVKEYADTICLYGGSVNSKNIREFLLQDEIKGVLVGGASVNKDEFVKILSIAQEI